MAQKTSTSLFICSLDTPRHAKTSSHSHPQKQSLGLRHNKALACISPTSSWLLLRVMASRAREACQPVRQTVLFLILLQKMGPLGTFLVASRKHRPHHSIDLYTPRPDYISQRPLLIHTTHEKKPLPPTQQSLSLHPTSEKLTTVATHGKQGS